MTRCEVCGRPYAQRHHIKTRGAGGSDDAENSIHLCAQHHAEVHTGRWTFACRYELTQRFEDALEHERTLKVGM